MIVMGALDGEQERQKASFQGSRSGCRRGCRQMFGNLALEEGPPVVGADSSPDPGLGTTSSTPTALVSLSP